MAYEAIRKGEGTFNDKSIRDFYRCLCSFASELAKAIGQIEPTVDPLEKKKAGRSRSVGIREKVKEALGFADHALTASEIMEALNWDKDNLKSRSEMVKALNILTSSKEVEVVRNGAITRFALPPSAIVA